MSIQLHRHVNMRALSTHSLPISHFCYQISSIASLSWIDFFFVRSFVCMSLSSRFVPLQFRFCHSKIVSRFSGSVKISSQKMSTHTTKKNNVGGILSASEAIRWFNTRLGAFFFISLAVVIFLQSILRSIYFGPYWHTHKIGWCMRVRALVWVCISHEHIPKNFSLNREILSLTLSFSCCLHLNGLRVCGSVPVEHFATIVSIARCRKRRLYEIAKMAHAFDCAVERIREQLVSIRGCRRHLSPSSFDAISVLPQCGTFLSLCCCKI